MEEKWFLIADNGDDGSGSLGPWGRVHGLEPLDQ